LVSLYETARRHIPQDRNLNIHYCENLKSHIIIFGLSMLSKARILQLTEMLSRIIHVLTSEETRSCLASIVVAVVVVVEEIYISGSAG
jgi:hypothetical protein